MAKRIQGITIEIDGETKGLDNALKGVNAELKKTEYALKDVDGLLKLDPSNTVLLEQKQELLSQAIEKTSKKLSALEDMQGDVEAAFKRGDMGQDKYLAFQREVEETRGKLNKYKSELSSVQSEQDRLTTNTERLEKLFASTGTEVDDYADALGSKLTQAIKSGTASADQMKSAIEKIGKAATGGKADIKQITDALDTVDDGQALNNLVAELNNAGDAATDTAGDIEQIASATTSSALMEAANQLQAVSDKLKEVGQAAVDVYADTETATAKVNAYFGDTGKAAEESAAVIEEVYTSGVGDSMDSVADAVITVKKNLGDVSETDLSNLTQQALTLEETYGIDMNETLRGVNSLMTQFGMSAQDAMDYIVKGTQNGLDKTNELGDNLSEYAGKWKQAGYSLTEYMQLLDNGLQGGAYTLDQVNDAINEVTTKLADGSIEENIDLYSSSTKKLFESWQDGGATQKEVIDSIVSDIANCTNQQEALTMASTAFGSKGEDTNLKFVESLTSVGNEYEHVRGSAEGMLNATTTPTQEMEANTRSLKQSLEPLGEKITELVNTILPPLVKIITTISNGFSKLPGPVQTFIIILGVLLAAFTALVPVIAAVTASVTALQIPLLPVIGIIAAVAAAIAVVIAAIENWDKIVEVCGQVWQNFTTLITTLIENFKTFFVNTFQAIGDFFSNIWNSICTTASNAWNAIMGVFSSVGSFFTNAFQSAWNGITGIFNKLGSFFQGVWDNITGIFKEVGIVISDAITGAVKTAINNVLSGAIGVINGFIGAINGVIGVINAIPGVSLSKLNKLSVPQLEEGGVLRKGQVGLLEGNGAEAVVPLDQNEKWIAAVAREMRAALGDNTQAAFAGDIVIPVYIGQSKISDLVVKANQINNFRSGGR